MIRLSRLADYGVVLSTQLAREPGVIKTATELAGETGVPAPTASKVLKLLSQGDVLLSHRGAAGGFTLARAASEISVADIISALDGPIALTECVGERTGTCEIEALCPSRPNWRRINDAVIAALRDVTMAEMAAPHTFDQTRLARPAVFAAAGDL